MKKSLFVLLAILACTGVLAQTSLRINNPDFTWQQQTQGFITSPEVVITPKGVYAQVEFTFKIHCQNNYFPTDSLEAVLDFELPANSFVHNSWLWLDSTTIIQADIVERGRAIQIYEGIVMRKRDPSLLLKTGENQYQLNVFPLTTSYPRKVKIVYSVPFTWLQNKVNVPLPTEILNASLVKPPVTVRVKYDNKYAQPSLSEQPYSNYIISTTTNEETLQIPYLAYENDLTLNYQTNLSGGVMLNTYATGVNEGIYQLVVDPATVLGTTSPKHIVFILDHQNTSLNYDIFTFQQVRKYVQSFLRNNCNSTDSFNIFYTDVTNTIQQTSAGWSAADAANISSAMNSLPNAINSNSIQVYEELIKTALAFCKTKPGNDAQVIMFSNSTSMNTQAKADSSFNRINAFLGGFSNKVHLLNTSYKNNWSNGTTFVGNELFFSKLALASGGNSYKYTGTVYSYPFTYYKLDVKNILRKTYQHMGTNLSSFDISIPLSGGFQHSIYDVTQFNRFCTSAPYVETGRYIGTVGTGNVDVMVMTGNGMVTAQLPLSSVNTASVHSRQAWNHLYIEDLKGQNALGMYTTEIIDSSISNRVLCAYTAFLAVETGDTITSSVNENGPGSGGGGLDVDDPDKAKATLKCYPNPFTAELTIEFSVDVEELIILDISGRIILSHKPGGDRKFVWNGRNNSGMEVPAGVYLIRARTKTGVETVKVIRK